MKPVRYTLLLLLLSGSAVRAQTGTDTLSVYFGMNQDRLSVREEARLDSLIYRNILRPERPVLLIGYCDYVGGEGFNDALSRRRAMAVQRYLITSGFRKGGIRQIIGKGEVSRPGLEGGAGFAPDRRVDIVVAATRAPEPPAPAPVKRPEISQVDLSTAKVDETFVLDNINFYPARHIPLEASMPALERLYEQLHEHKNIRVSIEGHICCPESPSPADDAMDADTRERKLSRNRAQYVYEYLVQKGINPGRLSYKGFGFLHPVVPVEETEEDQQKNRRVEIRITGR